MDNFKIGVGLCTVVVRGNKTLLGYRKSKHGFGRYAPPGGHIEYLETVAGAALREFQEETGLDSFKSMDLTELGWCENVWEETGKHYITIYVKVTIEDDAEPSVMEPDKIVDWKWYTLEEAKELPLLTKKMFEILTHALNGGK